MRRGTRFLLGASVAIVTAVTLHLTVGHRFHERAFGYHRDGCGFGDREWGRHNRTRGERFDDGRFYHRQDDKPATPVPDSNGQ